MDTVRAKRSRLGLGLFLVASACISVEGRPIVESEEIPPGTECPEGGLVITSGIDEDGDGRLSASEVDSSDRVCLSGQGSSIVESAEIAPGSECPEGGLLISFGTDEDNDGRLSSSEIDGSNRTCFPVRTRTATVISVPGDFASLHGALDSLRGRALGPTRIELSVAQSSLDRAVVIDHPDAQFIELVGTSSPSPMLLFTSASGIVLERNIRLGGLRNLQLRQVESMPAFGAGLVVPRGAEVEIQNITIENFVPVQIRVEGEVVSPEGAVRVSCRPVSEANFVFTRGISVRNYGVALFLRALTDTRPSVEANGCIFGFHILDGGRLEAVEPLTRGGDIGYAVESQSQARIPSAGFINAEESGIRVRNNAFVTALGWEASTLPRTLTSTMDRFHVQVRDTSMFQAIEQPDSEDAVECGRVFCDLTAFVLGCRRRCLQD